MIVESMNFAELEKEVLRDFEKLRTSTELRLTAQYDKERRKHKIDKARVYTKMYPVKTAAKNNWLLFISKHTDEAVYKSKGRVSICYVVYYYYSKGLSVIHYSTRGMQLYYGHFFKRYNERMNLGLGNTLDAAKKYFMQCGGTTMYETMEKDGKIYIVGFSREGILLGEVQQGGRLHINKTFVSRNIAFNSQDVIEKNVTAALRNELVLTDLIKMKAAYSSSLINKIAFSQIC